MIARPGGGRQIVENIPATAKITFGPVTPGKASGYGERNCLRIYTAGNNQLAVFTEVLYFRDLSLTVKTEKVSKKQTQESVTGPGLAFATVATEEKFEWEEDSAE